CSSDLAESYALPAGTTLKRHSRLKIIDASGAGDATTIYTGGGTFHWGKTAAPYNVTVALLMGDGTGEDYSCWGGAAAAPPVGAGWAGNCLASAPGEGGDVHRVGDPDSDGPNDWALTAVSGATDLLPGQYGSRRRSDIFVD